MQKVQFIKIFNRYLTSMHSSCTVVNNTFSFYLNKTEESQQTEIDFNILNFV